MDELAAAEAIALSAPAAPPTPHRAAGLVRRLRPYQYVIDAVIALAFIPWTLGLPAVAVSTLIDVLLMAAALAVRRISPALSLAGAWVAVILQVALFDGAPRGLDFAIFASLYACARYGTTWVRRAAVISVGIGAVIAAVELTRLDSTQLRLGSRFEAIPTPVGVAVVFFLYLVILTVLLGCWWVLGFVLRNRSILQESRAAERIALSEAAMARREMIIAQERNEIAREMHDIVAHSLTVVIAQADGAAFALTKNPDAVAGALSTIRSTARTALGDVALLLEQLRHSESAGPQPGIGDLDALFEQLRAAGLRLAVERTGEPIELGTVQQLVVYRIAQEALTNALRHGAPGAPVSVGLRWRARDVELVVENETRSSPDPLGVRGGHGLAGMAERAALVAGIAESGQAGSRYRVRAVVPASVTAGIPATNPREVLS